jgi:cardiolipin synthase
MNPQISHKYHYPWRRGNHFRLLVDGEVFFPAMLAAIEKARSYILLELYLFETGRVAGRFIDALGSAAHRGVQVQLLLDDFGAGGLSPADRLRLTAAGVWVALYNPVKLVPRGHLLYRDHRKLLLVDGRVAFTGGFGLTDDFSPDCRSGLPWRETVLEVAGPCVADWQDLFLSGWGRTTGQTPTLPEMESGPLPNGTPGRVIVQHPFPGRSEVMRSHIKAVRRSRGRIWLATAYFLPSWKLRQALRRAARRGADVRLLLPGPCSDHPAVGHAGRRYYERLLRAGVRIFEYQPSFLHAKVLLCDEMVSIGSSNLDRWNYRFNLEANQEAADPELAAVVAGQFEADFKKSLEISYEHWLRRPWHRHLQEWFWSRVGRVLQWLGERNARL